MLLDLHRAAGLHVDLLGPVGGHVLGGAQQRAVGTVEHIGEAVAIEVHQDLARLAVDGRIFEHVLVDAVVVPLVERRHLVRPHHFAGVDLAREDGHGPLVVPFAVVALLVGLDTAAVGRAPQSGVAARRIHEVQPRIVAVGGPHPAATAPLLLPRHALNADGVTGGRGAVLGTHTCQPGPHAAYADRGD